MTHMLSEPGFWEIDAEEYHSDPAPKPSLSQSIGKVLLERCPRSAWYAHPRLNPAFKPEDSTKFDRGTVAHQLLIGKGRDFHIIDAPDYRTKAAQMERDMARAAGKTPIIVEHFETATAMAAAARLQLRDIDGGQYAFNPEFGDSELCVLSLDPVGCWGRSLIDFYGSKVPSGLICWDYKTTAGTANPAALKTHFNRMGWAFQAAFQERLISVLKPALAGKIAHRFLVQEDEPPYLCSVVEPASDARTIAHKMVAATFAIWKKCLDTGQWPGYPRESQPISVAFGMEASWLERELSDDLVQLAAGDPFLAQALSMGTTAAYGVTSQREWDVARSVMARPPADERIYRELAPTHSPNGAPIGFRKDGSPRKPRGKYGPRKPRPTGPSEPGRLSNPGEG